MGFELDQDMAAALEAVVAAMEGVALPERDDVLGLRAMIDEQTEACLAQFPSTADVESTDLAVTADDGYEVPVRIYRKQGAEPDALVVYLHGGGMIGGTIDNYDPLLRYYVEHTGVPFASVGYRLAPEAKGTTPATDAFAVLEWAARNAGVFGTVGGRMAVMGDSGGGGIAAGAAILARDRGLPLARQILIYPMLDDRTLEPDPALVPTATWSYDDNYTAWHALLGDQLGAETVPTVAAPARLDDHGGLSPAYIEVGNLDIFRNEAIAYAAGLLGSAVSCEVHVHPGIPHGHDFLDPNASISRRTFADRLRVISEL